MKHFLIYILILFVGISCQSVQRFNAHLDQEVPAEKLKKDVDYVYKKLKKNHAKLDLYLPQSKIEFKFDSLKSELNTPLKPNEFYQKIQPIVRQLRHGHTDVLPLFYRTSKKENKSLKNTIGPMSQFSVFWENDSLYFIHSSIKDSLLKPGSVILGINGISPNQLVNKYRDTFYGDGFNETYFENRLNRNFFSYFYKLENHPKDSILYHLKYKGSNYNYLVLRKTKEEKPNTVKKTAKDTIKIVVPKNEISKPKIKNFEFSFDKVQNRYAKSLSFPTNDSTFAVLQVQTFAFGDYTKDYKQIFELIKSYKVKNLVLDLRNNGGGRLADSYQLFSYFVPNQNQFLDHQIVANKSSIQRVIVDMLPKYTIPITYPVSWLSYLITKKDESEQYYIKPALSRIKNSNPENTFAGNLYVIINGGSYSASAIISSNLKGFNRAYFVGEETGGDANGTTAGLMPNYQLPNSKLKLQIGTVYLHPKHFSTDTIGHGIFPDKEIKTSFMDKINKTDPQLRWILNDVKNNNQELKKVVKY